MLPSRGPKSNNYLNSFHNNISEEERWLRFLVKTDGLWYTGKPKGGSAVSTTVVVGMSGGVDSSVAALLLKEQGYHVIGVTLLLRGGRLAENSGTDALRDIEDARRVCEALCVEHRVLNLSDAFCRCVVDEFVEEYSRGRTPNPCVTCNRTIKFGALLEYALAEGADYVATGHYAHTAYNSETGRWQLWKAESAKDQSYVLYGLSQHQLSHTLFPLWGLEKEAVRALAREHRLPVADKGDSMETCFVPDSGHAAFIEAYTGRTMRPGDFVDEMGRVLGRHQGIERYTIGQRKGRGRALGQQMYVVRLDDEKNQVILGEEGRQMASSLVAASVNYISIAPPEAPLSVEAKIRYQAPPAAAILTPLKEGMVRLVFEKPQRSVTPGQAVVFYWGNLVLGGGTIQESA